MGCRDSSDLGGVMVVVDVVEQRVLSPRKTLLAGGCRSGKRGLRREKRLAEERREKEKRVVVEGEARERFKNTLPVPLMSLQ